MISTASILKLIVGCWDVFTLVWLAGMLFTKRTVQRESRRSRLRYGLGCLLAFLLLSGGFRRNHSNVIGNHILPPSVTLGSIGLGLTVFGLALAIWARATLGANWSASVTFKENHELIQRGPYSLVRHPIYTAMLLMFLGRALAVGTVGGLLCFPILWLSFRIKYRQEGSSHDRAVWRSVSNLHGQGPRPDSALRLIDFRAKSNRSTLNAQLTTSHPRRPNPLFASATASSVP